MPEIITDYEQGSDEWFRLRLASIGSTAINRIAPMKDGYKKCLYEFVGELVTGVSAESFKFRHADRGHEFEPKARKLYEIKTGNTVEQVAMIKSDKPHCHYSPDGLVGTEGLIEIKVRIPSIWIELAEGGLEPIADRRQRWWGLGVSARRWVDSINFCPEFAEAGRKAILIKRITRDEKKIKELSDVADIFIKEMLKLTEKYK